MMLHYSLDMAGEADLAEHAMRRALASGVRTSDIVLPNTGRLSTPRHARHGASGTGKSGISRA
jgi:hypothetical protein